AAIMDWADAGAHARWSKFGDLDRVTRIDEARISRFFTSNLKELIEDQLSGPFSGNKKQRAALNWLSAVLIKRYVIGLPEVQAVKVSSSRDAPPIQIEQDFREEVDILKELMWYYVFQNPALVAQQYGQ